MEYQIIPAGCTTFQIHLDGCRRMGCNSNISGAGGTYASLFWVHHVAVKKAGMPNPPGVSRLSFI
jgi:hypothetical protein